MQEKCKVGEFKNLEVEENYSKEETLGRIFQNIILNFSKSTVHNSTPAFESTTNHGVTLEFSVAVPQIFGSIYGR